MRMKRDMGLIRQILLNVEDWPPNCGTSDIEIVDRSLEEIEYNTYQAIKGGLLEGVTDDVDELSCVVFGLTPEGHDFLDNARNEFVWDAVFEDCKKKGITSASVDVVKKLLNKKIKKVLEL